MHLPSVPLLLILPLTILAHQPQPRRSHREIREIYQRAGAPEPSDALSAEAAASSAAAASAAAAAASSASSSGASTVASVSGSSAVSSGASSGTTSSAATTSSAVSSSNPSTSDSSSPTSAVLTSASPTSSSTSDSSSPIAVVTQSLTSTSASLTSTSNGLPSTVSIPGQVGQVTPTTKSTTTRTVSASSSSTVSSAADNTTSTSSGGLSKTAIIIIAVVASVVGLVAIGWTAFRKWKLRPSNRFDKRMKPIDFAPRKDLHRGDDFLEKTPPALLRSNSTRTDVLNNGAGIGTGVAGIPEHDFTAGATYGAGVGNDEPGYEMYNADPYHHAQAFEYDQYNPDPAHGQAQYGQQQHGQQQQNYDYPQQDDGYADLQRGGSQSSHGHEQVYGHQQPLQTSNHGHEQMYGQPPQQTSSHGHGHGVGASAGVYPTEGIYPSMDYGLGRPTGGSEGPYAQAAQYRGY